MRLRGSLMAFSSRGAIEPASSDGRSIQYRRSARMRNDLRQTPPSACRRARANALGSAALTPRLARGRGLTQGREFVVVEAGRAPCREVERWLQARRAVARGEHAVVRMRLQPVARAQPAVPAV